MDGIHCCARASSRSTNGEQAGFLAARHALRPGLEYADQHPYRNPKSDGEDGKEQVEDVVRFSLHMHPRDAARGAGPHELLMGHNTSFAAGGEAAGVLPTG